MNLENLHINNTIRHYKELDHVSKNVAHHINFLKI